MLDTCQTRRNLGFLLHVAKKDFDSSASSLLKACGSVLEEGGDFKRKVPFRWRALSSQEDMLLRCL